MGELEKLYAAAKKALEDGYDPGVVNEIIAEKSKAKFHSFHALESHLQGGNAPGDHDFVGPIRAQQNRRALLDPGMAADATKVAALPPEKPSKEEVDVQKVYEAAVKAEAEGYDPAVINEVIREKTNGRFQGLNDLKVNGRVAFRRGVYRGATFGLSDELAGLGAAIVPGGRGYAEARDLYRAQEQLGQAQHPRMSLAGEIVGGVATAPAVGAGVARTGLLGARGIGMAPGLTLAQRGARAGRIGGTLGAIEGAAYGAGTAEENRLGGAVRGGVMGGVVGGVVGPVAEGGISTARGLYRKGAEVGLFGAGRQQRAIESQTQRIGERIGERIRRGLPDRMSLESLDVVPQGGLLADVDPVLAAEARMAADAAPGLARQGGPLEQLGERQAGIGQRLAGDLRGSTGYRRTLAEAAEAMKEGVEEVRRKAYDVLEAKYPAIQRSVFGDALDNPETKRVLRGLGVPEGETISFKEFQNLRSRLRSKATLARRNGDVALVEKYSTMLERIDDVAEGAVPGFKEANAQYRIALARRKAVEAGFKAYNKPAAELRRIMDGLPEQARDPFREGLVARWEAELTRRVGKRGAAANVLDASDEVAERIRAMFPDTEDGALSFHEFMKGVEREKLFANTFATVQGGSRTNRFQQQARADDLILSKKGLWEFLWGTVSEAFSNRQAREQAAEQLGEILLSTDKASFEKLVWLVAAEVNKGMPVSAAIATVAGQQAPEKFGLLE